MTPGPLLTAARRQAVINRTDAAGSPGRLVLLDAAGGAIAVIPLAYPCGTVDDSGVALAITEYAQITQTGAVASGRLTDGNGALVGDVTTGLATDDPSPELPLPAVRLLAGAFIRLISAHIACD